jgi:L,D-transpeptidase YcbB
MRVTTLRSRFFAAALACTVLGLSAHAQESRGPSSVAPPLAAPALLGAPAPDGAAKAPVIAVSSLSEAIRGRVDHLRYDRHQDVRGDRVVLDEIVAQFYESQQFQPAWQAPGRIDALIATIMDVVSDGLDPTDYHLDALQSYRLDMRMGSPLTDEDRADLELLATDALVLALYHVYGGKVDPVKLDSQWNYAARPIRAERANEYLAGILARGTIREALDDVRPKHVWYQRGRERLREYRQIALEGGWPQLPEGPVLKPGMVDARLPILRQRLMVTKDLPATPAAAGGTAKAVPQVTIPTFPAESVPATDPALTPVVVTDPALVYDAALAAGVRNFQERHGLTADGVVGPGTRAALNVPVETRIDQIRINLERARWTLHEAKGEFVLVNVAGFDVSYFRDDEPIWSSRVVVGRDSRETPIFRSMITYVVFNPTWTIPPGILVKDKLPELRRNPGALQRMNIRVLDNSGREVDPYSINWNRYGPGRLPPFQFRQDPGPDNALGLVKIMFPNPHLVYLHDSPAKSLYERDDRAFSSGCIRVQKPFELAELVLNDPQWNQQTMAAVVASKQTRTVNLKKPVPVLVLYWTAQPRPDGQVIFRNDVYKRDAQTLAALNSDFRLPPRL